MSVGGTTNSCGPAQRVENQCATPKGGGVQQVPADDAAKGGGAASVADTAYDDTVAGGPAGECYVPAPAACGPIQNVASDAVDPNTGEPLNPSAPDPIAVDSGAPAPIATTVIDPNTGQPVTGQAIGTVIDPNTGQPVTGPVASTDTTGAPSPTVTTDAGTTQPPLAPAQQTTAPASSLPTWTTQYAPAFAALGLPQTEVDKIAAQPLTEDQLALVYMTIRNEIAAKQAASAQPVPGTPTTDAAQPGLPQAGASAWTPEWEQQFAALGLNAEELTAVKAFADEQRLDEAGLKALLAQVTEELAAQGRTPGAAPGSTEPAWTNEWYQKFKALGMPREIILTYRNAESTEAGIQAAYDFAKGRLAKFKKTGYYETLKKDGIERAQLWQLILASKFPTKQELEILHDQLAREKQSFGTNLLQTAVSFMPGVELAQYVAGEKFVTHQNLDKSSPLNIMFAGLSALALFGAVRGTAGMIRNTGVRAIRSGASPIQHLGTTTAGKTMGNLDAMTGANTFKTKVTRHLPFGESNRTGRGATYMNSAAKAYYGPGGKRELLLQAGDHHNVNILDQAFESYKLGEMPVLGSKFAWFGPMRFFGYRPKPDAVAKLDGNKVVFAGNVWANRGDQVLAGLIETGGRRIANEMDQLADGVLDTSKAWISKPQFKQFTDPDVVGNFRTGQFQGLGQQAVAGVADLLGATRANLGVVGQATSWLKPGANAYYKDIARNLKRGDFYADYFPPVFNNAPRAPQAPGAAAAAASTAGKYSAEQLRFAANEGREHTLAYLTRLHREGVDITNGDFAPLLQAVKTGGGPIAKKIDDMTIARPSTVVSGRPASTYTSNWVNINPTAAQPAASTARRASRPQGAPPVQPVVNAAGKVRATRPQGAPPAQPVDRSVQVSENGHRATWVGGAPTPA